MLTVLCQLALLTRNKAVPTPLDPKLHCLLLMLCLCVTAWPYDSKAPEGDNCPSSEWSVMCRPCCEYHLIQCRCPAQGSRVGYTVPCCRNALDQCDPCIIHPGCSLFENCKTCHNGTWQANDDFFVNGRFCTECRQGWSGGDCRTCGGVLQRAQGHVALDSYPTNARCEWRLEVPRGHSIELRFSKLSLEPVHNCRYDYVELRDGDSLSSPVIGRFCGDQLPPPARSSGNVLHVLFASDGYNNFDGFVFTFQQSSVCSPSPCLHQGTCIPDPRHSFRCVCADGYAGQRCEKKRSVTHFHTDTHSFIAISDATPPLDHPVLLIQWLSDEVAIVGSQTCESPEKPVNGDVLTVNGPRGELVSVRYRCHPPFTLTGSQQRSCLPNGTWSGTAPACVKVSNTSKVSRVRCSRPPKVLHGYHKPAAGAVGDAETIEFFCKSSYILSGNTQSTCLPNGSWSSRPPKCVRACREPKVSELVRHTVVKPPLTSRESLEGRLHLSSRYKAYDLLVPGLIPHTPDRQPESGTAASEELPRGFHRLYTSIEYRCASPLYQHSGSSRRTCLKSGRWSGRHVSCSPVCGKFATFSTHNLTDTQWPWHVAIYIRSPSNSRRDRVLSMSDQQGASEESGFWYLACSGALVTQRSVLLPAQCVAERDKQQPLNPEHVKVVLGIQQQTAQAQTKSLQHLRVSNILVHPNFYSRMDSDLALLKLTDKAKISERVLPVCLPRMQGGEVTAREAYTARWTPTRDQQRPSRYGLSGMTELVELADVSHCEREFAQRGTPTAITDNVLCVVIKPSSPDGACPGDIPGITAIPSVASSTNTFGSSPTEAQEASGTVWQLHGLESFNHEDRNCHRDTYTGQTRIINFRNWIDENMK
ncbi:inactive serine protease PAMR1 [Myripristis murdjan]|uniref:inactive serine protease PAMR1 n=1 Tax=Myripristis murdjan TaxID=586833 RepID=UPI0011764723|nr:inactive serine protease PAMR1-like [Myripristis murdjan]